MTVVLDASSALSWIFVDERDAVSRAIANVVVQEGAIVPSLWRWEVQNALVVAERRGRISSGDVAAALNTLVALPIEVEPAGSSLAFGNEAETARRFNLSVYDAAYVELALRRSFLIATRDGNLARAAEALGIKWPTRGRAKRKKQR